MSRNSILFSLVGALCVGGVIGTADAAPTVKKLGVNNSANRVQTAAVAATPRAATTQQTTSNARASSLRLGTTGLKTGVVTKTATANTDTNSATDTNRLSIGKYIHTSGVNSGYIKPTATAAEVKAQSDDILNLMDRVNDLETKIETKQDTLTAGDGVEIENNTVSIAEIIDTLPDKVDTLEQKLDGQYYTKDQVDSAVSVAVGGATDANRVLDSTTNEYETVSFNDVFPKDTFDFDLDD